MQEFGAAFGRMLSVVDRLEARPVEVALFVPAESDPRPFLTAAHQEFLPSGVIAGAIIDADEVDQGPEVSDPREDIPLFRGRGPVNGQPTVYICENYECDLAQTDPTTLRQRLARTRA